MRFKKFFFNDTATTEIYTLSLLHALPILEVFRWRLPWIHVRGHRGRRSAPDRDRTLAGRRRFRPVLHRRRGRRGDARPGRGAWRADEPARPESARGHLRGVRRPAGPPGPRRR